MRKAVLKEQVAERKVLKRPAAATKKPAAKGKKEKQNKQGKVQPFPDGYKTKDPVILMRYKKMGTCAIRIKNGRQLIRVASPKGLAHSKQLANEMKKMLEGGCTLGEVRTWKAKKLQG